MSKRVKPEQLQAELAQIISEYSDDVIEKTSEAVGKVAEIGVTKMADEVRRAGIGGKKYVNSFRVKKERGRLVSTSIIYSSQYQLTHLLEYGHIKVVYGHRVGGTTRAFPHWATVEAYTSELLTDTIKKAIGGTS